MVKKNVGFLNNVLKDLEPSLHQIESQFIKYLDKAMDEYTIVR